MDSGKFDWMAHADKFPGLCTPDDSYHGITYAERFGKEGAFITKATAQLMRDFGSMQSPMNAYMLNLGLESLHVRMQRHCENGMAVAMLYNTGTRLGLVHELRLMQCYLMPDETALRELSEGVIEKLKLLTDAEFAELEFLPD